MNNLPNHKLYYDIITYENPFLFGTNDMENKKESKNQVIFYIIQNFTHVPIISFCYEDVLDIAPDRAHEKIEVYLQNIIIKRDGLRIYFMFPFHPSTQATSNTDLDGCGASFTFAMISEPNSSEKKVEITEPIHTGTINLLNRNLFNNYNYIEKSILDKVDDHQDIIDQLVEQVKLLRSRIL